MGFMMPKPPALPAPPPPPPTAPDFSASMAQRQQQMKTGNSMGGTFLTAGQKVGAAMSSGTSAGKSLLGN